VNDPMKTLRPRAASISTVDQLFVIEQLILEYRDARDDHMDPRYRVFHALRAVADGLRARTAIKAESSRRNLGLRIAHAVRARTSSDWDQGALANVGLELVSRWPVVEQALERFEQILTPKGGEFDEVS
jgi:hypothetical protein